ncbi:SHOCT domain-containing protein [Hymenobacter endophyticus]|uniref:SHOCT domain-containing protein n=1 Tax=Hymenobacter endophyticus TaxID=3076335 RepID=A0ABU3TD79_9BACT|nr:SHOCT domain-containing protein [Hymenobacter endophyticus]MDU0369297.1 SHOCT domain-containing protein [Hymenobacter endophyticus]
MDKDSALDTLRQLKEWLDAGTITQQEFDALKQKLVFNQTPAPAATPPATYVPPGSPTPPSAPPVPSTPAAHEPTTMAAPVSEPLLPPVTTEPVPAYTQPLPPTPPVTTPGFSHPLEAGRPVASPSQDDAFVTSTAPAAEEEYVEDTAYTAPAKSPLGTILVVGGIVLLLALVAYLMLGNRESERLTSTTRTAADSLATNPEVGPQTEQIELPPAAAPETIRVAPAVPVAPVDSVATAAPAPAPAETAPVAPSATDEGAAQNRIESTLQNYYSDLQAAPFSATAYFAPKVERFYLQQNTTPAAINAELEKTHFPEFLEGQTTIEPGTLKVSPPVADGSRVVTFVERSTALRQSLQKRQQTAAQVRVRFDKNFKIVYLRQEKLLENNFID